MNQINMNPTIKQVSNTQDGVLKFVLSGVDTSIANALRRTILSDIPTVVFNASSDATIFVNTSRTNNEILKHQLSCIPIHITNIEEHPIYDYILEVNVENTTDTILDVTTEDFKIKNIQTNTYITEKLMREYFPTDSGTGDFILFTSLRPKLSDDLPGEKLHLECKLSIDTAKHNGKYTVASKCAYGCTVDTDRLEAELQIKKAQWKDEGKDVSFETKNWKLLDGLRIVQKNSFDFILQSIGVFTNKELVSIACNGINKSLQEIYDSIDKNELNITSSLNTMKNSFDIRLENQDYTIGYLLEFILYDFYYERDELLTFCAFKKMHPHDNYSIIRIAYKDDDADKQTVKGHLTTAIQVAREIFETIIKEINK
jgi:DNA-directed RNA polymerase subunit L